MYSSLLNTFNLLHKHNWIVGRITVQEQKHSCHQSVVMHCLLWQHLSSENNLYVILPITHLKSKHDKLL